MIIDILCSSADHPVNPWLERWMAQHAGRHVVRLNRDTAELAGGDILFLISCTQIVDQAVRDRYRHSFVLHASDLPQGRGWSPHVWELLAGATEITLTLLEADDKVDRGAIWARQRIPIPKDALFDEINQRLFDAELVLMDEALRLLAAGHVPAQQDETQASYYPRRRPQDSEVDPQLPIARIFDQLRLADPVRYPAFFRLHDSTYRIFIEKVRDDG